VAVESEFSDSGEFAPGVVANAAMVAVPTAGHSRLNVAVVLLALVAFVASLYLARAFFVPLLIGILASYALSPVVAWLGVIGIPRAIAAALVLAVLLGGTSWVVISLGDDAAAMIE
jgi:predicted PurR-regulated permease PerM